MIMTWDAFRLTSKSPAELLGTLGPHGVDHLIRQALDAVWREYPDETRSYANVRRRAEEVWARNMRVWNGIRKPSPAAFFEDLLPHTADQFVRQAMVLTWMMLPRAGGRDFEQTRRIITRIFQRNMDAWEEDNRAFTGAPSGGKRRASRTKNTAPPPPPLPRKSSVKKTAGAKAARKALKK